jgi:hypothetical protein
MPSIGFGMLVITSVTVSTRAARRILGKDREEHEEETGEMEILRQSK